MQNFIPTRPIAIHISHLFGLHGASLLAPWIWASLAMNMIAAIILLSPARRKPSALIFSCILIVIGIWIEKGLGFVVPGFIPSTLGDFVQYLPSANEMMQTIKSNGSQHGDRDGCVMFHGGNSKATEKEEAHKGIPPTLKMAPGPKDYYHDPGSIWIAENSCGACHVGYVYRARLSLMNTEAGKIQGNLHTWGFAEVANFKVPWGNYDQEDLDGPEPIFGSEANKAYMKQQISLYPDQYPTSLKKLPSATMEEINSDPKMAALTYQRYDCQRCHLGVRGREKRGDYRGMGCSACHILYSNDGYYEGDDKSIPKDKPGHMLKHEIVATRKTDGIPVESCNSCHNRGKRIGVSFQGLMEFPYGSPFDEKGAKQPKLHTKKYLFISDDLHHQYENACHASWVPQCY